MTRTDAPRIVVTTMVAATRNAPDDAARKNELYADGVRRHGGVAVLIDATATAAERGAAFASMDGLLLTGGADLHPSRYGRADEGSSSVELDRDALDSEAWEVAEERGVPVLGICRGFQAINVFAGGTLLQHVDGHAGPGWGHGPAAMHALRLVPGTRLASILADGTADGADPVVNSYHHQAVRASDLAHGLQAGAWASSEAGDLIEGFEAADGRFVVGVQCHPERTESTPASFERLWAAFVEACRDPGPARRTGSIARTARS
jgi:putative glutamine amidotransferase